MKNFSLSLYAFHLRHTLTQLPGEVVTNAHLLWENLVKVGENSLFFIGLKDLRLNLVCYENNVYKPQKEANRKTEWLSVSGKELDLGSLATRGGFKINANLQPFLLNDTYAIDLTLVPESQNTSIDIAKLQDFQPISLLPSNIEASLGQTLWIYGEVDPNQDCDKLAQEFATALVAGTSLDPVLINKGELLDSLLFEYQALDPNTPDNPAKECQILIVINNNQSSTVNLAGQAYDWLLRLFWSYHKIRYIYQLARQRYQEAREVYSDLENKIQDFNSLVSATQTQLSDLKSLMAEIPQKSFDYIRCLQDLQTHYTAVTTNITNYEICLNKIQTIGGGNSPQSWQDFLNKECQKWQKQIETDINYLTPGQELFGQFVDTIRGIVETQQAERDRSLENKIQILGIGFGSGAIVSGIITQHIDKINRPIPFISPNNPPNPFYASLLLSFFTTLFCMALGWWITKRK
ncbi:hypothetical protein IQ244_12225 [Nostoc sp. LEGE 06077]|uniref:hypothetical protein n=1 Tax=Nostoc sp. LEGE 06077 TaxID=915325 RepID=UPI00187E172C|nr:hypothetical protein [Nostoc sp. LEGE 06077]MBE9207277.1 hypothetical protein [Nostoc sp. LEGE 06077]